jgi:hypothetical protein
MNMFLECACSVLGNNEEVYGVTVYLGKIELDGLLKCILANLSREFQISFMFTIDLWFRLIVVRYSRRI